ncbi:MAG: isocitrate/isopropylmalate family dehydrogenase, partial [Gammaproteobacteria bacterium]
MPGSKYRIAVIPGDGIGMEVVPEGLKVLEILAPRYDINFEFEHFDWSCERYLETGAMMPEDGIAQLSTFDAIFLGAVGFPTVLD